MSDAAFNQTLALILIIFCVPIIMLNRAVNRKKSMITLQSTLFGLPLVSALIMLYAYNQLSPRFVTVFAQSNVVLVLLGLQVFKPSEKILTGIEKVIICISLSPLLLLLKPNLFQEGTWATELLLLTGLMAIMALLVIHKRKHTGQKNLNTALVLLFAAQACLIGNVAWTKTAALLMHCAAYVYFLLYFYRQSMEGLTSKIVEAESKLLDWERSIRKEVNKRVFEIERSNSRLLDMAKTDPMTQVFNKVNIISIISSLADDRHQRPFTVLMFDIDNFKNINDTRGHLAGDGIIKQAANTARSCVRGFDSVGRYGGDEFIIVLPNTALSEARFVAERLRKKIAENEFMNCTVSIGLASFPADGANTQELIKAADEGLYISKQRGRNMVSHRDEASSHEQNPA